MKSLSDKKAKSGNTGANLVDSDLLSAIASLVEESRKAPATPEKAAPPRAKAAAAVERGPRRDAERPLPDFSDLSIAPPPERRRKAEVAAEPEPVAPAAEAEPSSSEETGNGRGGFGRRKSPDAEEVAEVPETRIAAAEPAAQAETMADGGEADPPDVASPAAPAPRRGLLRRIGAALMPVGRGRTAKGGTAADGDVGAEAAPVVDEAEAEAMPEWIAETADEPFVDVSAGEPAVDTSPEPEAETGPVEDIAPDDQASGPNVVPLARGEAQAANGRKDKEPTEKAIAATIVSLPKSRAPRKKKAMSSTEGVAQAAGEPAPDAVAATEGATEGTAEGTTLATSAPDAGSDSGVEPVGEVAGAEIAAPETVAAGHTPRVDADLTAAATGPVAEDAGAAGAAALSGGAAVEPEPEALESTAGAAPDLPEDESATAAAASPGEGAEEPAAGPEPQQDAKAADTEDAAPMRPDDLAATGDPGAHLDAEDPRIEEVLTAPTATVDLSGTTLPPATSVRRPDRDGPDRDGPDLDGPDLDGKDIALPSPDADAVADADADAGPEPASAAPAAVVDLSGATLAPATRVAGSRSDDRPRRADEAAIPAATAIPETVPTQDADSAGPVPETPVDGEDAGPEDMVANGIGTPESVAGDAAEMVAEKPQDGAHAREPGDSDGAPGEDGNLAEALSETPADATDRQTDTSDARRRAAERMMRMRATAFGAAAAPVNAAEEPRTTTPQRNQIHASAKTASAEFAADAAMPRTEVATTGDAASAGLEESVRSTVAAASAPAPAAAATGKASLLSPLGAAPATLTLLAGVACLVCAAVIGNGFALMALVFLLFLSIAPDDLIAAADDTLGQGRRVTMVLAIAHLPLLALALFALGGGIGLSFPAWLGVILAYGLYFGQISASVAHGLSHSSSARRRLLGQILHVSLLVGPYSLIHRFVHHRFAATPYDPMTAETGEGFWAFAGRSWTEGLAAGWEIGEAMRGKRLGGRAGRIHPYVPLVAGGVAGSLVVLAVFGLGALLAYLMLSMLVRAQLMAADYVAHYGMVRRVGEDGRIEPLGPKHSWESPHLFPPTLSPRVPRLPDHRAYPPPGQSRRDSAAATDAAPELRWPMPAMAPLALIPPIWHRVMRDRLRAIEWQRLSTADRAARRALGADDT